MHVPVALSGDAPADVRAVTAALTDGRAACVFDGVAPAGNVRLTRAAGERPLLELSVEAPDLSGARFTLLRDGAPVAQKAAAPRAGNAVVAFDCGNSGCGPGDYRIEATWDGRPWIFTNPVSIE
jgi:hypothetical protein